MPKNQFVISTLTTDRFLNNLGGIKGSFANLDSTTTNKPTKSTESTSGTMTAADFHGNVWPPKLSANKKSVANANTITVPA